MRMYCAVRVAIMIGVLVGKFSDRRVQKGRPTYSLVLELSCT